MLTGKNNKEVKKNALSTLVTTCDNLVLTFVQMALSAIYSMRDT